MPRRRFANLGLEGQRRPSLRHRLHIATDAEGAAGTLQQHGANLMVLGGAPRGLDQAARHIGIERIAPIRPVHGDGQEAAIEILQNHVIHVCVFPFSYDRRPGADSPTARSQRRHGVYFFTSGQRDSSSD